MGKPDLGMPTAGQPWENLHRKTGMVAPHLIATLQAGEGAKGRLQCAKKTNTDKYRRVSYHEPPRQPRREQNSQE